MLAGMKKSIWLILGSIGVFLFFFKTVTAYEKIDALPVAKIASFSKSYVMIPQNVELKRMESFYIKYKAAFDSLHQTLHKNAPVVSGKLVIIFSKIEDFSAINRKYCDALKRPESYLLTIGSDQITVISCDDLGLLHGLSTLEALVEKHAGKLPEGWIVDYPDTKMRILHLSLWPCKIEDFKKAIRLARIGHYNGLIWLNHYGVKLKSLEHLSIKNKNRWSVEEFKDLVQFVKENGMEVIPELKFLSHQKEKFLGNLPLKFKFNQATYDPRKTKLYESIVFPAIDELLALTGATKFHIGHDEVIGWSKNHYKKNLLNKNEKQLPHELFLKDVLTLQDYLNKKGVETWMWSDMLYTKEEFPNMKNAGASLNGFNDYASLRDKIPKDIVMCVWHYKGYQKEFPTALTLANNGHRVLGAVWKSRETVKNFANYIQYIPSNAEGMIATTWYGLSGDKQEEVYENIKFSANVFWNVK